MQTRLRPTLQRSQHPRTTTLWSAGKQTVSAFQGWLKWPNTCCYSSNIYFLWLTLFHCWLHSCLKSDNVQVILYLNKNIDFTISCSFSYCLHIFDGLSFDVGCAKQQNIHKHNDNEYSISQLWFGIFVQPLATYEPVEVNPKGGPILTCGALSFPIEECTHEASWWRGRQEAHCAFQHLHQLHRKSKHKISTENVPAKTTRHISAPETTAGKLRSEYLQKLTVMDASKTVDLAVKSLPVKTMKLQWRPLVVDLQLDWAVQSYATAQPAHGISHNYNL